MEIRIEAAGKEYLEPAADMMTEVFKDDPALRYMLSNLPEEERLVYLRTYLRILFKSATLNSGTIENVNDWESCAVWMPPGKRIDNVFTLVPSGIFGVLYKVGVAGVRRMMVDYQKQADESKREGLKGYKKWIYLFFIGTASRARGKGLATEIIRRHQITAQQDNLPIWLEATTPHSRDIYAKCGFELVHEMRLGNGTHDANGAMKKGGPGIRIWAMIWKPDDNKSAERKVGTRAT